jgi:glycosyltransferase involved in cell wall biosynthesis
MSSLSVVIITLNEEENLPRCLASVSWADDIIVVDSHSTDRTREIAASFGARVFPVEWRGFGAAKQEGVNHAVGDWILSLDADEEVTPELAAEIKDIRTDGRLDGYYISRRTLFLGRWIRHCGWSDGVLRLFKKGRGRFDEALIHEKVVLDGRAGLLKGELLHYSYPTLESYFDKFDRYTTMGAESALRQGKSARWYDVVLRPPASFVKHYVSKQGFRDGIEGFTVSALSSVAVLVKYVKLRDLRRKEREIGDQAG